MKTLLIPCAGASSRFPGMRPKWLLTHPDGKLMIVKAIEGLNIDIFDRIVIVILQQHVEKFHADLILKQAFRDIDIDIDIVILPSPTSCASETVYQAVCQLQLTGSVVVKDSDNKVVVNIPETIYNGIGALNIYSQEKTLELRSKSFLLLNDNDIIIDIIEKKIMSDCICVGVYAFENIEDFCDAYKKIIGQKIEGEIYLSHVISYMICTQKTVFRALHSSDLDDWGTLQEWRKEQLAHKTYFVDFDGICIMNSGKYGIKNWDNNNDVITENLQTLKNLQESGAQIIITTSRPQEYSNMIEKILSKYGIHPYAILTGLHHAPRVLINDFAPTNPYPSAEAINIPRNGILSDYVK